MSKIKPQSGAFSFTLTRARKWFLVAAVFIQLSVLYPVYSWFGAAEPLIAGFPPSFAWIIFVLLLSFLAIILLYRADYAKPNKPAIRNRASAKTPPEPNTDS
ncbi:MAG: hypothetical protein LAT67_06655 [Balneolales bacterium]|nr:hypothetical protein [Balneolales bacterium]